MFVLKFRLAGEFVVILWNALRFIWRSRVMQKPENLDLKLKWLKC